MNSQKLVLLAMLLSILSACSSWTQTSLLSHTNIAKSVDSLPNSKASFLVKPDRGDPELLMILAFSGGGSRAAYWSASVMLQLEQVFKDEQLNNEPLNLLKQVDAISAVSGGGLPAAYYAISTEPGVSSTHDRAWSDTTVRKVMTQNYISRWIGNWFWPSNIAKYWFTAYDRTDIMAQTLADNLYDVHVSGTDLMKGRDLSIGEINPERPYLILNATNATSENNKFGKSFTFTQQDFDTLDSDINDYSIARAVMASASFPGAFNSMTLQNYSRDTEDSRYLHVFDGGNVDNLGLLSVERILDVLEREQIHYRKLVVILVDAFTGNAGISETQEDPRSGLDFFVDSNIVDATDSLLANNRDNLINQFEKRFQLALNDTSKSLFYHIQFSDVNNPTLKQQLYSIKTSFNIEPEGITAIDAAVDQLIIRDNPCLQAIKQLLVNGSHSENNNICVYRP